MKHWPSDLAAPGWRPADDGNLSNHEQDSVALSLSLLSSDHSNKYYYCLKGCKIANHTFIQQFPVMWPKFEISVSIKILKSLMLVTKYLFAKLLANSPQSNLEKDGWICQNVAPY